MGATASKYDPTRGIWRLPDKEGRDKIRAGAPINPGKVLFMPKGMEQVRFWTGWFCWVMDSYNYFAITLSVSQLEKTLKRSSQDITYSIMLALLTRSAGAILVGIPGDRFGRRWVLCFTMIALAALSLATPFTDQNFSAFLGVRALFGVFMGGVWGLSTATSMEDMQVAARGLYSGILQQGYAAGNLLAAVVHLGWVQKLHWKNERGDERGYAVLFYLGAGLALLAAIIRALVPEGPRFKEQRRLRLAKGESELAGIKSLFQDLWAMVRHHWIRAIYSVLLMAGFNFFSHASQDLYPKMLQNGKTLSVGNTDRIVIISMMGAICGGMISGWLSQYLGRRLTMLIFVIIGGAVIPAWILPNSFSGLAAGGFWVQFGVQGSFGPVPIYLSELSPPAFRATFPGLAYQLGNMASSAAATIETRGGEHIKMDNPRWKPGDDPKDRQIPDFGTVSAILLGCVAGYMIIVLILGDENPGAEFELAEEGEAAAEGAHVRDIEAGKEANKLEAPTEQPETVSPESAQSVHMDNGKTLSSDTSNEAAPAHT